MALSYRIELDNPFQIDYFKKFLQDFLKISYGIFFLNRLYMNITAKIIIISKVIIINEYYSWTNRQQLDK